MRKEEIQMPDNILYGVFRENAADANSSKCIEYYKNREQARKAIIGYNSINKNKNIKYSGVIVQMEPWKILGPFNESDYKK